MPNSDPHPNYVLPDELVLYAIQTFGLSIRQIPMVTHHVYNIRHFKEGDEIVMEGRGCKRTKIPEDAGYWMCQEVPNTSVTVHWNKSECNLAPTLAGSVKKYWNKRNALEKGEV